MTLTDIQQTFVDIGTQYSTALLQTYFKVESNSPSGTDTLENASMLTDTMEASVLLAGGLSGPVTMGASVAAAAAIVVMAKTGRKFYDWCQSFAENSQEESYPDTVKRDVKQLRMQIQLHRAIYQYAVRYAYGLHEVVDRNSLWIFSEQTSVRLMKIMLAQMQTNTQVIPDAEDVLDGLLASAKLSVSKEVDVVTIQHPRLIFGPIKSTKMPSKLLWARPIWYIFDEDGRGEFISSPKEHDFLKTTTLRECGIIAVPRDKLQLTAVAVNLRSYKSLTEHDLNELPEQLIKKLCFFHVVTRFEVDNYLETVRQSASSLPQTLNDYLTNLLEKPVIAVCHSNELSHMDLSGGCFSGVDFNGADLSGCNLCNTDWSGRYTWLSKVKFDQVLIDERVNLQGAHAEESIWLNVKFGQGINLSLTKLNGATFIDCVINPSSLLQLGTEWLLATFKNLHVEDPTSDLEINFQKKLNLEQQQRLQLEQEIHHITKAYEAQSNLIQTTLKQANTKMLQTASTELKESIANLKSAQAIWLSEYDEQLNQIRDRCDLIQKAIMLGEAAIIELQQSRQEENERWSEQSSADLLRDKRLTQLEPSYSVINRLLHYCKEEINTRSHQLIKSTYIELKAASLLTGKENELESLSECLDRHMDVSQHVLLLHGEQGCGKSTTLKLLFEEQLRWLWIKLDAPSTSFIYPSVPEARWIPILIDLYQVQAGGRNSLRSGLECYFDKSQVDHLIEKEHCLMMIDNIDVGNISLQQLLQDCAELSENFKHKPKFIFSMKTSYLLSLERDYREIFMSHRMNLDAEYMIHAFDPHQIKRFFSFYHGESAYQRFIVFQRQNTEIRSMLKSPLMLSIVVSAFFSNSFNEEKMMFRSDFYAASWHALHEHVKYLLPAAYKDYEDFIGLIQQLALAIFEQGQDWVTHPFEKKSYGKDPQDPLSCLFYAKIKYLLFLAIHKKNNVLHIRFMHPSLGHYWVAQCLFADLCDENFANEQKLRRWNLRNLREFPSIINFLVDLIKKDSEKEMLLQRLMRIVMLTKNPDHQGLATAASNAMMIRYHIDKNFNHLDLSDIAIPHADLPEGLFVGTSFARSKLNGVRFTRATLLWADMQDAVLTKTQFLDATSFIQTDGPLKVFAVYPSLSATIIAFVIEPTMVFERYKIVLMSVQEGLAHKLKIWAAHSRRILSMAWGITHDIAYLASAGEGGTIRVWRFKDDASNLVEELIKFSDAPHKAPISVLVWGPNGTLIASGSDDGYVSIWDIEARKKIYKSPVFSSSPASSICALGWGKETNVLIAINEGKVLYLWQDPEKPNLEMRLRQITLHTIFSQSLTPVSSMALSWNEQQLALGQINGDILIMSLSGMSSRPMVLQGHQRQVSSLCWAGPMLVSSSTDHTVRMWQNPKFSKILQHEHAVERVELLPSGRELVSGVGGTSHRMYFWNIDQPNEERLAVDPLGIIMCLAVSRASQSGYSEIAVGFVNGAVILYTIEKQTQHVTHQSLWEHEQVSVSHLSWSMCGQFLASFAKNGTLIVKNIQNKPASLLTIQSETNNEFNHLAWIKKSVYSGFFVVGLSDGSVRFYDVAQEVVDENKCTLQLLYQILSPSASSLHYLAVSPSDEKSSVATIAISRGLQVEIWMIDLNPANHFVGANPHSFKPTNGSATALVWSPDGNYLASVSGHQLIEVWNSSYTCVFHFDLDAEIKYISWCEKWLIVGSSNKMFAWDTSMQETWTHTPICVPIGASLLEENDSNLVLGENRGIWICDREKLFAGEGAASWIMQVKPELLMHQANGAGVQASPSTKELFVQKGGIVVRAYKKFSLFRSNSSNSNTSSIETPQHLPKPSTREELNHLRFKQFSSHSLMISEDFSASTTSSPQHTLSTPKSGSKI